MFIWENKKFPVFARYYISDSFVHWTIEMLDLPKIKIIMIINKDSNKGQTIWLLKEGEGDWEIWKKKNPAASWAKKKKSCMASLSISCIAFWLKKISPLSVSGKKWEIFQPPQSQMVWPLQLHPIVAVVVVMMVMMMMTTTTTMMMMT